MIPTRSAMCLLLLLAGCASSPPPAENLGTWTKPGGTPEEFDRDRRECQQEAMYPSYDLLEPHLLPGMAPSEMHIDPDLYGACMRARVYRRVD